MRSTYCGDKRVLLGKSLIFLWRMERAYRCGKFPFWCWPENPWLSSETTFLGEVESALGLGIMPWSGDMMEQKLLHLGPVVSSFTPRTGPWHWRRTRDGRPPRMKCSMMRSASGSTLNFSCLYSDCVASIEEHFYPYISYSIFSDVLNSF